MIKIDHIGIAVSNLSEAVILYEKLLGCSAYKYEKVQNEGVKIAFFKIGSNKIELLEGINSESSISKFVNKKGQGVHHIAFDVDDIISEIKRLQKEGFVLLNENPKKGAENKLVAFLHPKSMGDVLIELCQEIR